MRFAACLLAVLSLLDLPARAEDAWVELPAPRLVSEPVYVAAANGVVVASEEGLVSTDYSVARSEDGGAHWSAVQGPTRGGARVAFVRAAGASFFLGAGYELWQSLDGGKSWLQRQVGSGERVVLPAWDVAAIGTTFYLATSRGLLSSTDGGQTWRLLASTGEPLMHLLVVGERLLVSGGVGLAEWDAQAGLLRALGTGLPAGGCTSLAEDGGNLYCATGDGLYRSRDGGRSFAQVPNAPGGPAGQLVFCGTRLLGVGAHGQVFGSTRKGPWEGGLLDAITLAVDGKTLWAARSDRVLVRSDDAGAHWTPVELPAASPGSVESVGAAEGPLFAVRGTVLFRSDDRGAHWTRLATSRLGVGRTLAVQGRSVLLGAGPELWFSRDAGEHWTSYSSQRSEESAASVDGARGLVLGDGVRLTKDGGASWEDVHAGLPPPRVVEGRFGPEGVSWDNFLEALVLPRRLFVATTNGLYSSPDGHGWRRLGRKGALAGFQWLAAEGRDVS